MIPLLASVLMLLVACGLAIAYRGAKRAPFGFEDASGFHDATSPRVPERRRAGNRSARELDRV